MSTQSLPALPDGRTRYVYQRWVRDSNGPLLANPPPRGIRTPNGLVWGHDLSDFFWIERIPGMNVLTTWSRSMLKEHGENYDEVLFKHPDSRQVPRLRRPWPILKLPRKFSPYNPRKDLDLCYGIIDPSCDEVVSGNWTPKRREELANVPSDDATPEHQEVAALVNGIFDQASPTPRPELGQLFVLNDPHYPLLNPNGQKYALLFCPRLREMFSAVQNVDPTLIIPSLSSLFVAKEKASFVHIDPYGIAVSAPEDADPVCMLGRYFAEDDNESSAGKTDQDVTMSDPSEPPSSALEVPDVPSPDDLDKLSPAKPIPEESPYSVKDLPKLEEFIPNEYMPDVLYVHDPHRVTIAEHDAYEDVKNKKYKPRRPIKYTRLFPKLDRNIDPSVASDVPSEPPRIAHLHLAHQNRFGVGNHSLVHRAPLTLPTPLSAHSRNGRVTVAAKSAFPIYSARALLKNEGKMYSLFPEHLMQDWCGYNMVTPIRHPVPVGPVVPKFYGYYVPEGRGEMDEDAPSPIILMEECGDPVEPHKFTPDARSECYSMMLRLHFAGFTQGSFYVRNILVQPGPLTAPPEKRSKKCPSFRIIDFGRGEEWDDFIGDTADASRVEKKKGEWGMLIFDEDRRAQRELQIEHFQF